MSLATLARKTRTRKSKKGRNCFVLNMTGRGQVIGQSAKYNSGGKYDPCRMCHTGKRGSCCGANHTVSKECRGTCSCWYNGLSQPAPQMGYGVYLARKAGGAYRPSGTSRCCKTAKQPGKNPNTWKQTQNLDASVIIEQRRLAAIQCSRFHKRFPRFVGNVLLSNKFTAAPTACSAYGGACLCDKGLKIKGRLGYTRINHNWCTATKASECARTASEQIALVKSASFSCNCPAKCTDRYGDHILPVEVTGYDYTPPQLWATSVRRLCGGAVKPGQRYRIPDISTDRAARGGSGNLPAHTFWQWRPLVIFLGEKDARDMLAAAKGAGGDFDSWVRSWGGNARCLIGAGRPDGAGSTVVAQTSQSSGQFIDVPAESAKWPHGECTPVTAISIWSSSSSGTDHVFLGELQLSGCVDNLKKPVHTPCRT